MTNQTTKLNTSATALALKSLFKRYMDLFLEHGENGPSIHYDSEWLSPCISGSKNQHNEVHWKPVEKEEQNLFVDIEKALDVSFHPSVIGFYGNFWSDGIWGTYEGKEIALIQVWNEDDLDMLRKNMLGHAFAKGKNRQSLTLFIGCTDGEEIVSVNNETGEVIMEIPGKKPQQLLADSLADFLDKFIPNRRPYSLE